MHAVLCLPTSLSPQCLHLQYFFAQLCIKLSIYAVFCMRTRHPQIVVGGISNFSSCAGVFPPLPPAENFDGVHCHGEANFLFVYDYACGAFASVRARIRQLVSRNMDIPDAVQSWATCSKWLVDKFHMRGHIGTCPKCWHRHVLSVLYQMSCCLWWL